MRSGDKINIFAEANTEHCLMTQGKAGERESGRHSMTMFGTLDTQDS